MGHCRFPSRETGKGGGISFMEHPAALQAGGGLYRWHAGAPSDDAFQAGYTELLAKIRDRAAKSGLGEIGLEDVKTDEMPRVIPAAR